MPAVFETCSSTAERFSPRRRSLSYRSHFRKRKSTRSRVRFGEHRDLSELKSLRRGQSGNERHFSSKLTDADGEQLETQHWTRVAFSCGYLEEGAARSLVASLEEIGRLLQGMIDKADLFCSASRVAETPFLYKGTDGDDSLAYEEGCP